jgi:hypothetical protein
MVNPRLSIQGELATHLQTLSANGDSTLQQGTFLVAAQYWVTPRLWLKGGMGISSLTLIDNGFEDEIDQGGTFMAGIGYEIVHGGQFAMDLMLRTYLTDYADVDQGIEAPSVALGINWY